MAKVRVFDRGFDFVEGEDTPVPVSVRRPRLRPGPVLPSVVELVLLNQAYGKMVLEFSLYECARLVEEFGEVAGVAAIVGARGEAGLHAADTRFGHSSEVPALDTGYLCLTHNARCTPCTNAACRFKGLNPLEETEAENPAEWVEGLQDEIADLKEEVTDLRRRVFAAEQDASEVARLRSQVERLALQVGDLKMLDARVKNLERVAVGTVSQVDPKRVDKALKELRAKQAKRAEKPQLCTTHGALCGNDMATCRFPNPNAARKKARKR